MSEQKNDGGPAFPVTAGQQVYATGMTLRDWFAGQALLALGEFNGENWAELQARTAYRLADAMLAERSKP